MLLTEWKYIYYLNVTDCWFFEENIIWSVDFIYIYLFTLIIKI